MKIIPLSEAKANLSKYGKICQKEPVIVTVNGHPSFQLVPLEEEDDLVDQLLEHHDGFQEMMRKRLRERTLTATAARKRL